ncbi:MAG: HEAT repeat domain-containing protein [bacterium]
MSNRLLMTGQTRSEMQAKFCNPSEPLSTYWKHFLLLAQQNPFWFSSYSVLAFVVTEEDIYRQHARDLFLRFTREKDAGLLTKEVQFHTHTASAPLGRMMALYDWIADTDLLTADEDADFRAAVLDYASLVSMQQLQGRARKFDNQVFSNAFGAAVTGYVLGISRGDSPLAQRLYAIGMESLLYQFGNLPPGCYSGEGSTYHMQVVIPLFTMAGAFVEEVTGLPLYQRGVSPAFVPLRDWLVMARDLVGPGGLLPGWDAYGVYHSQVRSYLAYLALRDNDIDALALISDANMWYSFSHIAWEFDDRMWTLVWWPENIDSTTICPFYPWMNSSSVGALQHAGTKTRLVQYWDECGGGVYNGRGNVNPNAIDLQSGGLPLLLDGAPAISPDFLNIDRESMLNYLPAGVLDGLRKMMGQPDTADGIDAALRYAICGSIGESNSLVIDGENWYVPLHPAAGKGLALHDAGGLQVIESDAVDYYRDRYDVTRTTRISALIDGRIILSLDDWISQTPHKLTWQAFTWPGAIQNGNAIKADIGSQMQLDLLLGQAGEWDLTQVPGYPKYPVNGSTRIEYNLPNATTKSRVLMGMVIQNKLDTGVDISDKWVLTTDCHECKTVDLSSFYLTDNLPSGSNLTFTRSINLSENDDKNLYLRINSATLSIKLNVNDIDVPLCYEQQNMEIQGATSDFAHIFNISSACRNGENKLILTLNSFHGESIQGPITLHRVVTVKEVSLTPVEKNQWLVAVGADKCNILMANESGRVNWLSGQTDARHAVYTANGELSLAGVSSADFPEMKISVKSNLPIDVAFTDNSVRFGILPNNSNVIIRIDNAKIVINATAVLQISSSAIGKTLACRMGDACECIVNGKTMGRRGGTGDRLVEWQISDTYNGAEIIVESADDVYKLTNSLPTDLDDRIISLLQSNDWRIQMAAADIAGVFDIQTAIPELLRLLAEEENKPPHPPLIKSWSFSKMNSALEDGVDKTPDLTIDPVEGTKRYRLKRALITALGRLGDKQAVEPLENIMACGDDFFPALAQVPIALARLGSESSIPILENNWDYGEVNVRIHVHLAHEYMTGKISKTDFEKQVNPA